MAAGVRTPGRSGLLHPLTLAEEVAGRARREGPLRFDQVVELALYHEQLGFYARGGGAGRERGDFLTSPQAGPLFGAVVARALDAWWVELGEPDPYVVVEAGAGGGELAAAVVAAEPRSGRALRYVLVERSPVWMERQASRLPLEPPGLVLGPVVTADPDLGPEPVPGSGPLLTALPELPAGPVQGVLFANELLDNLPFRLLERVDGGWAEVRVSDDFEEVLAPADPEAAAEAGRLAPDANAGSRIPLQHEAQRWVRQALATLGRGRVVVVDYADTTRNLAGRPWTEWVRTYRRHGRGGHPLQHLGEQDITCEVAVDQLVSVRPTAADRSQAEFLRAFELDELAEHARQLWRERAHLGDLQAMAARSRVSEASALTDPGGVGGFRVLEWEVR
jgi:SAM-dependent MidA family methyltransferase